MDLLGKAGIVASPGEPSGTGVILHPGELGVFVLKPDFHLLHLGEFFLGQENADSLKVVGEHLHRFFSRLGMFSTFKKSGVDMHGPAFDVLLYRFDPADFFGRRFLRLVAKGKPGGGG